MVPAGAPPFPHAWYEYRHPPTGNTRGSFIRSFDASALPRTSKWQVTLLEGARWVQLITSFLEWDDSHVIQTGNCCLAASLDDRGRLLRFGMVENGVFIDDAHFNERFVRPPIASWYSKDALALFFQGLLSCKNVDRVEVVPPEALSRKHARRHGGLPYVRYHTLRVRVPGTKRYVDMDEVRRVTENPVPLGLHLVRGHFKTYTPEHGLFGKIAGTFYWPPELRGSLAAGAVGKHYVEQPAEANP
jgi:hypothetical protein